MKSCPTCNRTFEDSFTFCLIDGAVLSAPFDAQATKRIPAARATKAPPTEVLPSHLQVQREELPPTVPSPVLTPTMPHVPLEYSPPKNEQIAVDRVTQKQDSTGWIVAGLTIGAGLGLIFGIFVSGLFEAILLSLFGAVLGALIGKLISTTIQKDSA